MFRSPTAMRRLRCVGDSNTWGYDPRSYGGSRYAPEVRWTGRLPGWEVVNDGVNGREIPAAWECRDMLCRSTGSFDAVLVMLGTNDLLQGSTAVQAGERMEAFLRALLGAETARVLLVAPPPFQYGDWVTGDSQIAESKTLGAVYRALAEELCIPFADAGAWDIALCFDGVHFTPEGHAAFAEGLLPVLAKL